MKILRRIAPPIILALVAAGALFAAPEVGRILDEARFPHRKHANIFPLCTACHAGVIEPGASLFPEPARCAACHDGTVERTVSWSPRIGPRPGNRRFTHSMHDSAATRHNPADSAKIRNCSSCHNETGAIRMAVENAVVTKCLSCHGLSDPHFDVPSRA